MGGSGRYYMGILFALLAIAGGYALLHAGVYGWTIFVVLPVFLGGLATWVFRPATQWHAAGAGALTVMVFTGFLLLGGLEGFLCILMALPLVVPLGALAGWLAYHAMSIKFTAQGATMLLLLSPAALMWDAKAPPPVFEVRTSITVAATREQTWKNVVSFSELPAPREWYFRRGIAYPERARIEGSGPDAVRFCEFSTGAFVEPIEVWDEPHLLQFRVSENPAPMREWSPYADLQTKHLHGYLVSKRGEFRLTKLPDGQTRLEGITWYQNGLWPAEYWRLWSDAIIHRIHLRVLNHIRMLAECGGKRALPLAGKVPARAVGNE